MKSNWRLRLELRFVTKLKQWSNCVQSTRLYIIALPKSEHAAPEWQAAMQALILVAENGGPIMFARIGVMRVLNRQHPPAPEPRRKRAKAYRTGEGGSDEAS